MRRRAGALHIHPTTAVIPMKIRMKGLLAARHDRHPDENRDDRVK
ncbi:MAG: hypothetical protein ACYC6L_05620 [Anaerolineae bacterium]